VPAVKLFNAMFRPAKPQQMPPQGFGTFPLEEILTPSGLIDTSEETAAIATAFDLSDDLTLDFGLDSDFAAAEDSDSWQSPEDFGTLWTESGIDIPDEDFEDVDFFIPVPEDVLASIQFEFESGYFTVQDSGLVTVDYLFDGGGYQGELAIFSLDGMEEFELGSEAFVYEAARRALSGIEEGHIVISDHLEGARFDGQMLGEVGNWNSGDYLGAKTFQMRPGDEFGFMLVPSGRVETVFENPGIGGSETPLFSMSTANPDDMFAMGQLVDVFGDGNAFAFEDLRIDGGSDQDYNDIVFQVRGATGTTIYTGDLTSSNLGWLETDLGEAIKTYAQAYVDWAYDGFDANVSAPPEAQPLIGIIDTGFNANNPDVDYSRITLGSDWIDGDANPLLSSGEGNEHGTHILGLIGATQDNDIGIDGINDQAPLWLGRAVGSGQWANSLVEFVDAAIESGQPNAVVNLSLDLTQVNPDGSVTTRYELTPAERAAIDYARQHEIILVVSAGNDGDVMSVLGQASQEFDNIITVGSAERANAAFSGSNAYERADYSSYGQGLDILASGGTVENPILSTVGDGTGSLAGTSVATAKVTGAISKVWVANPDLSYLQVIDLVKSTATDLQGANWDTETGAGLLNLAAAMTMARATTPEVLTNIPATLIPASWSGEGVVTPTERAAATPFMGKYYDWSRYTIRSGDTLSGIAQRTMGSGEAAYWNFIYNQNRGTIANPNLVYPGQMIWVPREVAAPTPTPTPTPIPTPPNNSSSLPGVPGKSRPYVIRRGDTLWAIAQRKLGNGNRWREIMKTPTGGTFTEAEARILQPNVWVYLPVNYETGSGKPVTSKPDNRPAPSNGTNSGGAITTYAEYIQRLYGGSKGVITQIPNANHNAIDSVHQGVAPHKVYSLTSGEIKYIGTDQYGGKFINVWNSELQRTFTYLHFNNFNSSLQVGQTIGAGTHLGNEGWTGYTIPSGPNGRHTHVHVRDRNGIRENPLTALGRLSGSTPTTTPTTGNINLVNFSGTVGPKIGVNLRYSPQLSNRSNRNEPYNKRLEFDAWTTGQTVADIWLGTPDSRWFRVKGTNLWVPSAYIWGNPPGSGTPNPTPSVPDHSNLNNKSGNLWGYYKLAHKGEIESGDDWTVGLGKEPSFTDRVVAGSWRTALDAAVSSGTVVKGGDPLVTLRYYDHFFVSRYAYRNLWLPANDPLSLEMYNHSNFKDRFDSSISKISQAIDAVLKRQLKQGSLGNMSQFLSLLRESLSLLRESSRLEYGLSGFTFDTGNLHVIINGTQKREVGIGNFVVDYDPIRNQAAWSAKLRYTVSDDFAFSEADGQRGGLVSAVLKPAYEIQNLGVGRPYSISLVADSDLSGRIVS
jgi:LysM repeat protein